MSSSQLGTITTSNYTLQLPTGTSVSSTLTTNGSSGGIHAITYTGPQEPQFSIPTTRKFCIRTRRIVDVPEDKNYMNSGALLYYYLGNQHGPDYLEPTELHLILEKQAARREQEDMRKMWTSYSNSFSGMYLQNPQYTGTIQGISSWTGGNGTNNP